MRKPGQRAQYLRPQRYRVTFYRAFAECGVAQEASTSDEAFRLVWARYAPKYLPTPSMRAKAQLCWEATKLLFGDREKPTDRVYHVQNQCALAGVRIRLETY